MGKNRNAYVVLDGKPEGKRHREELVIDTRLMLKLILKYFDGRLWAEFIWCRLMDFGGKYRNERFGSLK
jgi:hypothetical protein